MTLKPMIIGAAVLALLAACGTTTPTAATAPQTSPSSTTSAAPVASPTAMTKQEAAKTYARIVNPPNRALGAFKRAIDAKPMDLTSSRAAAGVYAEALRTFSLELQHAAWPADVQAAIDALVAANARDIVEMRSLSRAQSTEEFVALLNQEPDSGGGAAAELVRQKLGLPEAPSVS